MQAQLGPGACRKARKTRRVEHLLKISIAGKMESGYSIAKLLFPCRSDRIGTLDLEAPASLRHSRNAGCFRVPLHGSLPIVLALTFSIFGAAKCYAQDQDVAEAARQERTRKQSQQKKNKYVYTAEDLKREHILTPEDRAQLDAKKNQPAPADGQKARDAANASAAAHDASTSPLPDNAPLGEVARRLRKQKESQKLERSAEFHLPFSDTPVLASPRPPAQPLRPPAAATGPAPLPYHTKRSPFERPRFLAPSPAVSAPLSPTPGPHVLVPPPVSPVPSTATPAPGRPRALTPAVPSSRTLPAPPARVAPAVSAKPALVTVRSGDSLWKLAAERLGNGRRWQELLALNPGLHNPDLIKAGSEIVLPASVAPARTATPYTVRHGDALWTIARAHFGHGASWPCIAHANPNIRDANLIHEGDALLLPASCRNDL